MSTTTLDEVGPNPFRIHTTVRDLPGGFSFNQYLVHAPGTREVLERLAALEPERLACMHGSAYKGGAVTSSARWPGRWTSPRAGRDSLARVGGGGVGPPARLKTGSPSESGLERSRIGPFGGTG